MKLLLVLGLATITLAGFCIEGLWYVQYDSISNDCGGNSTISQNINILNTVNIIRNNVYMVINVGELKIGDKVKSYDYQYTEILSLDRYTMVPEIISPLNCGSSCQVFVSPESVFTDSEALTYINTATTIGNSQYYYTELANITHNSINPIISNYYICNNCSNYHCNYEYGHSTMLANSFDCYQNGCIIGYMNPYLYYSSDLINYISYNLLNQPIYSSSSSIYYYRNLTIAQCEAVKIITANGYIMVNNILFRN